MIHGLLHGIRLCLLRATQGFAARRRPGARRKRGGFMGRAGIDLFIEDGAYTTLSSAVVILVVLTLLFSSTAAIWSMSRAGDTQVAADSGALAGANVVSSYHTAATVVDASILSLGLAGFATIGTGLVAILIPGAEVVGSDIIDTGTQIIKTRNKFAKSAAKGLQKIETALPYLVAARAMQAVSAQDTDGVTYTGLAVSYDTDVVDDLVDGSMYGGQSDCYIVRTNGDIVLALEPQTELCEGMTNLYDIDAHADWIYGTMDDIRDCVQLGRSGSAQFICQGGRNYLVAIPTAFPDWTLVGIIRADEVDGAMHSVQQSTIIALGALCIFAVIIVVLALGMESQLRLRREEEERLSLEREKMQSDRLLQSMSRIVDRYSIINLDTDRYRYRELRNSEPLYPASGRYSDMVETISRRYVALTETENAKLSRLITPEYLRSVLRKPDDNLKIEYCSRTENAYMVLTVIPVEWHADGTVYEVMQVVQDIGQKIELENMANTDSMTGLFNERYFSRVLNICEEKKLPFVLYYLDLDRFKPINDTYGHLMGDRLLKEIAARLLRCIRSRDYAFRIGGDEFALIVSADMDEEQRARMAERIQTTLSAPVVLDGTELSVGVSCGCACYPEDGSASQVRIAADSRMYETKQRHHENDRTEGES